MDPIPDYSEKLYFPPTILNSILSANRMWPNSNLATSVAILNGLFLDQVSFIDACSMEFTDEQTSRILQVMKGFHKVYKVTIPEHRADVETPQGVNLFFQNFTKLALKRGVANLLCRIDPMNCFESCGQTYDIPYDKLDLIFNNSSKDVQNLIKEFYLSAHQIILSAKTLSKEHIEGLMAHRSYSNAEANLRIELMNHAMTFESSRQYIGNNFIDTIKSLSHGFSGDL